MNPIRVEYRGISGELSAGDTVIVKSCEAGVLVLHHKDQGPVQFDEDKDLATVYGVKIAGVLLREFAEPTPAGQWFRVIKVENGVSTLETRREDEIKAKR